MFVPTRPRPNRPQPACERGFSLIEVAVAMTVFTLMIVGVFAAMLQSRKMTESSIYQNSAVTVVQGYIEQMKNMDFNELPYYDGSTLMKNGETSSDSTIYTQLDSDTYDTLKLSSGAVPTMASVIAGTRPTGAVDNSKKIDINNTPDDTADDLVLNIWVWIVPLDNAGSRVGDSRHITMIYNWSFATGGVDLTFHDSVTTVRSRVPTF
jgi:Tfp pilus assembly protein PilV